MRKIKILTIVIGCLISFSSVVFAQTPPEVLKPYKQYNAAIVKGDYEKASKAAYSAWKTAERVLGSTKTTGDLALNYALLGPKIVNSKEHKSLSEAFLRAIELAVYHQTDVANTVLDRHLEYLTYLNSTSIIKGNKFSKADKDINFSSMETALEQYKRQGTWHEAVMEGIRTSYFKTQQEYTAAIRSGAKARSIFEGLEDQDTSNHKYQVILDLGRSQAAVGNHLKAALTLQSNFQNTEKNNIPKKFVRQSETAWKQSWVEIYKTGEIEIAYAEGLCECVDLEDSLGRPEPILRIPPIMPPRAARSGEAIILFDVRNDGTTENIRIASYTEKKFGDVAMKAGKKFIYTPTMENADHRKRLNLPARFTFKLKNGKNEIIPAKRLKTIVPITLNQDMIDEDSTIKTTGSRIRIR